MKLLPKSNFPRLHLFIAAFTLLSLATGLSLNYGLIPGYTIRTVHFYSGLLIIVSPAIVLVFMKKRRQILSAAKSLIFINSMDIKRKRYLSMVSKVLLNLFILGLVKQLLTGLVIGLKLFNTPDAVNALYKVHTAGLFLLPILLVLHVVLMIIVKRTRVQPAKQNVSISK